MVSTSSSMDSFSTNACDVTHPLTPPHDEADLGASIAKPEDDIPHRPLLEELPLNEAHPKYSAWGLWGENDELGTLNFLTLSTIAQAAREIKSGRVIPLNLPMDEPLRPMNPLRKHCIHKITAKGHANDDELDINTQSSSHWDGLRHYPYQHTKQYYNGVTQADITGVSANNKISIQHMARKGIAGRGVLLDHHSWAVQHNIHCPAFEPHSIPLSQLLAVAASQNVTFHQGDILLIRSGWMAAYNALSAVEKDELGKRAVRSHCGVEASEEMIRWHWDVGFAAVAGDTVAYEAWPSLRPVGVALHEVFLSGWGMPIGETWDLEELAGACREAGRWTFFLTSQPLNVERGVASPANVMAIL